MVDRNIFVVEALDEAGNKDVTYNNSIDQKTVLSIKKAQQESVDLGSSLTKEIKISDFFTSTEHFFPELKLRK